MCSFNVLTKYIDAFGKDNLFVELQQNLVKGDVQRNKILSEYAKHLDIETVATNNVHYHLTERSKLQDVLVAIKNNTSLEECSNYLRFNNQFYLKSAEEMQYLFAGRTLRTSQGVSRTKQQPQQETKS